ncbi:MAG: response regulator [Burkholderiales bacterium]
MKIFLVEDSIPIRQRLVEMIEANGLHSIVGEADNFEDAVAGISRSQPDVAIFDIKLARGNGIHALAEAKRRQPGLRSIVMSNYTTPQHRKASADAGADYFLDKSADFERITEILSLLHNGQRGKR